MEKEYGLTAVLSVMLKAEILDPAGRAVTDALHTLGYDEVQDVRIGKQLVIVLAEGTTKREAKRRVAEAADKVLANPVIEEFRLVLNPSSHNSLSSFFKKWEWGGWKKVSRAVVTVSMKAAIGISDNQSRAALRAAHARGYHELKSATTSKLIVLTLTPLPASRAEERVRDMCEKLLANPVIEEYRFSLE